MHRIQTTKWRAIFAAACVLAILFGGLIAQSVRAVSPNPAPVCVGSNCSVTFAYTGDYYQWSPPAGAQNVAIDLLGAQGGRSGGLGGRVTGSFVTVPTSLYIYVGGAGNQGSGAVGGYNGGGAAGSGRGDEGSGGGATDIRTGTLLADRIAVAGGGGGSGGFSGGGGGGAGGVSGSAGTSGQGQGGSGATATAGGSGGFPNGGSWGSAGELGLGGIGGSSTTSGGGGGGGGYYGGGGGGADIDSCCTNAGGGGGGSSWVNATALSGSTNTGAYRSGAGLAIISYVMPPSVTTFAPNITLTNLDAISYSLIFNETVTGLANTDFVTTGSSATCSTITVTGSLATYTVAVSGCTPGILNLKLSANSVTGLIVGPSAIASAAAVTIDRSAPTVLITPPATPTNAASLVYTFVFNESVTGFAAADLSVVPASCVAAEPVGSATNYSVSVSGCADAASVVVTLAANSVADAATNAGPAAAISSTAVTIKRTAAEPVFATTAATSLLSPSFGLTFSESVTGVTLSDFSTSAPGCVLSLIETLAGRAFTIATSSCALGPVQVSIAANSYSDSLGNRGPVAVVSSGTVTVVAAPTPTPTPTPVATATPTATPTSAPTSSPAPTQVAAPVLVSPPSDPSPPAPPAASAPAPVPAASPTVVAPSAQPVAEAELQPGPVVSTPIVSAPIVKSPTAKVKTTIKKIAKPVVAPVKPATVKGAVLEPAETSTQQLTEDQLPTEQMPVEPLPLDPQTPDEIVLANPTEPKPFVISENLDWQMWVTSAALALAVGLAGVGIFRGSKNLRQRRLEKKYA